MKLAEYPAYRPSQIEWVNTIPVDWEECSAKINYLMQLGKMLQNDPAGLDDIEISYLKALHVNWNRVTTDALPKMWASPSDLKQYAVSDGDLLVCEGGEVGRAAIIKGLEEPAIIQNALHRVKSTQRGNVRYFCYLLKHIADAGWFAILCNKATIAHLTSDKLGAIYMPVPTKLEQKQIADFLDWKTGQINALIAKKQQLIEKLHEQRIAVITQTVTKGVNPDAPLRDSGIQWLGEVPEHWEVYRVKYAARMDSGHTPSRSEPLYWVEEECVIPWVSLNDTKHLKEHDYISDTAISISENGMANSSAHLIPKGSVVFTRDATIGLTAITTREMAVSQHIIAWIPTERVTPEFLLRCFQTMNQELESYTLGSTLKTIGMPDVKKLVIPVPPAEEQQQIADRISKELSRIDAMSKSTGETIIRLTEYRVALITAATTGKIDVRDVQIPPAA